MMEVVIILQYMKISINMLYTIRGCSTLRDPICCIFLCVPFLKDSMFLMLLNTGRSRASRSSQDWDHGKVYLLGFLSVTLQWLSSATLCLLEYPFCYNWWNFILCNGWVIILLKIYKHTFLLIKYPCSTKDLGPPRPSFCLHSLRSVETYQAHFVARAFETSLRGCPVPS